MIKPIAVLAILVTVLVLTGCGGAETPPYTVSQDESFPYLEKREVRVGLESKISESGLRAIAEEIKDDDPDYDVIHIVYHVRGMDSERAAWATTHFTPDLRVVIHGLTPKEEQEWLAEPVPESWQIEGRWISDQAAALSGLITVYTTGGQTFVERKLKDSGTITSGAVEVPSPGGRRFNLTDVPGEYVVIDAIGEFRYYTRDHRVFEKARPVK